MNFFGIKETGLSSGVSTFFSPGDECLNAILTGINNSKKEIKICVFTISDDRIAGAMLAAHKRGVKVFVITDNDKALDKGSDIAFFAEKGIPVRVDNTTNHMHHKFAIFDDEHLLTGSYNWTRSAALYNHENILIIEDKAVVKSFEKVFDALWKTFPAFK